MVESTLSRPHADSLAALAAAAKACRNCSLWERATQIVLGEGPEDATMVLVGETPGNDEDIAGHPFVGPAGKLLNEALRRADIPRERLYVTNAVKHFKWVERGPRRLHQKPSAQEVRVCHHWLAEELRLIGPKLIVCLGATAGQSLLGASFRVSRDRGRVISSPWGPTFATNHPSAILRMPDKMQQDQAMRHLVLDLQAAWKICQDDRPVALPVGEQPALF